MHIIHHRLLKFIVYPLYENNSVLSISETGNHSISDELLWILSILYFTENFFAEKKYISLWCYSSTLSAI